MQFYHAGGVQYFSQHGGYNVHNDIINMAPSNMESTCQIEIHKSIYAYRCIFIVILKKGEEDFNMYITDKQFVRTIPN